MISGASQGSITGPVLFNFLLCLFISSESMYNFADDNFLSTIAKTVVELKNTLQSELEVVISWLKNNKTVVNNNQ